MELHLVNDLPLLGSCADEAALEALVADEAGRLAATVPAHLHYIGFPALEQMWARAAGTAADVHVLVGTRPDRLWARAPAGGRVLRMRTARQHGADGRTQGVAISGADGAGLHREARVCVLDDVLMSGNTVRAVLAALPATIRTEVRVLIATAEGVVGIRHDFPGVPVEAEETLRLRPIREVTVFFLADLLFGTLLGRPFLQQTGLLRPFLGDDLAPLVALSAAVVAQGGWRGPRW
ncbi:hypothetical protein AB0M46_22745 [Dactylosporangium sp. NPDC051485]|uniref:hypothetical protein n=1 Tax=Dactylosporangium sp. NPDC051485 TaxID=3154846 RepID=UPI003423D8D0